MSLYLFQLVLHQVFLGSWKKWLFFILLSLWHIYYSILLNWDMEKSKHFYNAYFSTKSQVSGTYLISHYCCKFQSIFCTTKNIYIKWQLKLQKLKKLQKINCKFFLSFILFQFLFFSFLIFSQTVKVKGYRNLKNIYSLLAKITTTIKYACILASPFYSIAHTIIALITSSNNSSNTRNNLVV